MSETDRIIPAILRGHQDTRLMPGGMSLRGRELPRVRLGERVQHEYWDYSCDWQGALPWARSTAWRGAAYYGW